MNVGVELTVSSDEHSQLLQGVIHINNREPSAYKEPSANKEPSPGKELHLGIPAWSLLDPSEETEPA